MDFFFLPVLVVGHKATFLRSLASRPIPVPDRTINTIQFNNSITRVGEAAFSVSVGRV